MNKLLGFSLFALAATAAAGAVELPLKEVTIFSSGVAYYEHEMNVSGTKSFELTFDENQIDDFLKSVAISDAGAKKITLQYSSSDTLQKTLESLPVDLSTRPTIFTLLKAQIGSTLHFTFHDTANMQDAEGRLLSVEKNTGAEKNDTITLSVLTESGVQVFSLDSVLKFTFNDAAKNEALIKALQLLDRETASNNKKTICITIDGAGDRTVRFSYVLGAPVWKTTYRLILGNKEAVFQAWAIVDNSTNVDWTEVKLNLVTGKPVSFRQNLYDPFYVARPEIPLPVEGAASLEMYDSAMAEEEAFESPSMALKQRAESLSLRRESNAADAYYLDEGGFSAESSVQADTKFIFTPANPVSLQRQKSMMLPLKLCSLPIKKMTVFSNVNRQWKNPKLCVELTNTSGLNLPAGAITLYDDGYSGDSMIKFLPKDEKRLISYGDDLLLSGSRMQNTEETVSKLSAADGVLHVAVERLYTATYQIKNNDTKPRSVIIEHPIAANASLYKTEKPVEQTADTYRFSVTVPANASTKFTVMETETLYNQYGLTNTSRLNENIFEYVNSGKAPTNVIAAFKKIAEKQSAVDTVSKKLSELQKQEQKLNAEQERTRKNRESLAGTNEAAQFTAKLLKLEEEIVAVNEKIDTAQAELTVAENELKTFLKTVTF